jgi:hypothetical protein
MKMMETMRGRIQAPEGECEIAYLAVKNLIELTQS